MGNGPKKNTLAAEKCGPGEETFNFLQRTDYFPFEAAET